MSCLAVNDTQRSAHWRTGNWNCPHSLNPSTCASNEVQIQVNSAPGGGWFGGCGLLGNKTQYVCSPPYPTDTNSLWGCCSGATGQSQCDPAYCPNSGQCNTFLQTNCNGKILFSNDGSSQYTACNTWCSQNPIECGAIKKSYCNNATNIELPVCQSFAQSTSNNSDNTFDSTVQSFCATHQTDPFCSCQLKAPAYNGSDSSLLKLLNAPQCYDPICINNGYENSNQISFRKNGNCPTSICSNQINVNSSLSNINNVIASCESNSAVNTTSVQVSSKSTDSSLGTVPRSVLFFIFMIIIAFVFWLTGSAAIKGGSDYKDFDYNEYIN